jgi:hypothetical protein
MSTGERGRNEKPAADQQGEGETADDREGALPAGNETAGPALYYGPALG